MSLLLAVVALAHADPSALRAPSAAHTVALSGSTVSYGGWHPTQPWGVAIEGDFAGGPIGAWFAGHAERRAPSGFGVDVQAAAGLLLTGDVQLALGLAPAATVGWRGPRVDATLGLVAPLAFRFTSGPALSVPILLEPWVGVHLGAFTVGAGAAAGPVLSADELWAVELRWRASLGWTPPRAE